MNSTKSLALLLIISCASIGHSKINKSSFKGEALEGKDVVSLYQSQEIIDGNSELSHEFEGAKWYFSSQKNLDLFKTNPKKFVPAYGGYCAWAVAQGYTAGVSLETATVVDGVLYLNYNADVAKKWSKDIPGFIESADKNWPEISE